MTAMTGSLLLGQKSFDHADEIRTFDNGLMEVVTVGGHTIGRATFSPGWRWSQSVKPIANTELCESEHLCYVISGRMGVLMKDGTQAEFGPGDAMYVRPQHDAWVIGQTPCVLIDFLGMANYAKR